MLFFFSVRRRHTLHVLVTGVQFFFFKQKTAYELRISDWSSDVCSSDLSAPSVSGIKKTSKYKKAKAGVVPRPPACATTLQANIILRQRMKRAESRDAREIGRASCRESVCQYV